MADTFRDVWGRVALQVPDAPVSAVQEWVQEAYTEVIGNRHYGFLRTETVLTTLAARSVTVTFVQDSTGITSAAGFVVATDPGRQIRVGNGPTYTIDTVSDVNTATLTQAYRETGGAASARISDVFLAMPADFRSIYTVTDRQIQRPIAWWISQERLDLFDPGRIAADVRFRVMAGKAPSQVTSLLGRALYEAWPAPTGVGSYLLTYFKKPARLTDDDTFKGVLDTDTEVLKLGALARAARWPGTVARKNPYFNLMNALKLEERFEQKKHAMYVYDDDQYLDDLAQTDLSKFGLAALSADTTLMRQSDATLADYY